MSLTTHVYELAIDSPFGSLVPDFSVFGTSFDAWWKKLFAGLLALAIIYTGAKLVVAFAGMHKARNSGIAGDVDAARSQAAWAGVALGSVASFAALSVAVFTLVS